MIIANLPTQALFSSNFSKLKESKRSPLNKVVQTTPAATTTTVKEEEGYNYPVPENPLIIEKPAPGLPTLYGAPPIGKPAQITVNASRGAD